MTTPTVSVNAMVRLSPEFVYKRLGKYGALMLPLVGRVTEIVASSEPTALVYVLNVGTTAVPVRFLELAE